MAYLTLVEAAKIGNGTELDKAIIEIYSGSSQLLAAMQYKSIMGNALKYTREANYPGVGFRGIGEAYVASNGVMNPLSESLVIAGGDLDVDKFTLDTEGQQVRGEHVRMKATALALSITNKIINGDNQSDPREFDGLKVRTVGAQLIKAGTTASGDALSLYILDTAIDQTLNPTHIICNKAMARRFSQAARNTAVGGHITFGMDDMGKRVMAYNGLPLLVIDLDNNGTEILPFTEAAESGSDVACSMYVVSMGGQGLIGLQNGTINVRDLGELETQPVMRTRVEWYVGMAVYNGRAVTRVKHIKDAAIIA